jgi:hypothetical protein
MTTTAIEPRNGNGIAVPSPGRVGQATAVEQSRAVAEVQAAIVVAQQCPRDISRAQRAMRQSCGQKALAERAFFSYPRSGETITGPSVQLARELARCFGNLQYGISELRRDDGYGQSEMLAFAWDVETNTRSSTTFVVPHRRDTKKGVKALTEMRDIYENNANNGARRLREMIFAVLPAWFTEEAVAECYETLADVDGVPMADRIKSAVSNYAALHVSQADLERKVGAPSSAWSAYDVAHLGVVHRSIMRGEARKEDEFPAATAAVAAGRVGTDGITGSGQTGQGTGKSGTAQSATGALSGSESAKAQEPPAASTPPDPADAASPAGPEPAPRARSIHKSTLGNLRSALASLPFETPEDVPGLVSDLVGRKVELLESLHQDEGRALVAAIDKALSDAQGDTESAVGDLWAQARAKVAGQ